MSSLIEEKKWLLPIYKRYSAEITKGRDCYLYDKSGGCYLDLLSGLGVNALGHYHPAIIGAIEKQLQKNLHLSNYFIQDVQVALAKKLVSLSIPGKVFFTNSGTESIEGILKLVNKWARLNDKNNIFSLSGSFHGRSLGALTLTGQEKYQKTFRPLLNNIHFLPFNDIEILKKEIDQNTAAVFLELIEGESGIQSVSKEYIQMLSKLREKFGFLIIVDEIQTGIGRTGKFFAYEHFEMMPDIVASAKALGGGLPLGAFVSAEKLKNIFKTGDHGTTFGGNPLACASGLACVNIVSDPDFLLKVEKISNIFFAMLYDLKNDFSDVILKIRGKGLMIGVEIVEKAAEIVDIAFKNGVIINKTGESVIRFLPPLIINEDHVNEAYEKLKATLKEVFRL